MRGRSLQGAQKLSAGECPGAQEVRGQGFSGGVTGRQEAKAVLSQFHSPGAAQQEFGAPQPLWGQLGQGGVTGGRGAAGRLGLRVLGHGVPPEVA